MPIFTILAISLMVSGMECLDGNHIEETHVYINENGIVVDEILTMDKRNGILKLFVPAHHNRITTDVIFDENSQWMMTVDPKYRNCFIMKKHSMFASESDIYNEAKKDVSQKEHPIEMKSRRTKVVELELSTTLGYKIPFNSLPIKFQQYCPRNYTIRTTRMMKKDEKFDFDVSSEADLYDFVPGLSTQNVHRSKRRTHDNDVYISCEDYDGLQVGDKDACSLIHGIKCPDGLCVANQIAMNCRRQMPGDNACWYFTLPCERITNGDQYDLCIAHMTSTAQTCHTCCQNQNCCPEGKTLCSMPKCQLGFTDDESEWCTTECKKRTASHKTCMTNNEVTKRCWIQEHQGATDCKWGQWSPWSKCSKDCGTGIQTRTRATIEQAKLGGEPCEGEGEEERECTEENCETCGCNAVGTTFIGCNQDQNVCFCKPNFIGKYCDKCKKDDRHFPNC